MSPRIPFNRPTLAGNELDYMSRAVAAGHTAASGPFTERASALLRSELGAADVLLTTSCTDALEMAALLLDLGPDDVVIVPSFTFVSTALAFTRTGARLLFCDIEPDTLGLDPTHLAELVTDPRVRAVVVVHYAGVGADVAGIEAALAGRPDVALIEDNAHGLFGRLGGRPLGSFGRLSTLSFHETKNFVCGEGGALVLNDPADRSRARTILHKGTNRDAFLHGRVDKYTWVDTGSSFGLSDLLAAYLVAQLEARAEILERRRAVFDGYVARLAPHAAELGIRLPVVSDDRVSAHHMFHLLVADRRVRDAAIADLAAEQIQATFHYVPLHSSPGGQAWAAATTACPVTDDVSGRLLRLPFANDLTPAEQDRVCAALVGSLRRQPAPASPVTVAG